MWIRSQNKKSLINVNRLYIAQYREGGMTGYITKWRICNQVSWINETDDNDVLGTYETEERAIEVLDNIAMFIDVDGEMNGCIMRVYEMPKE